VLKKVAIGQSFVKVKMQIVRNFPIFFLPDLPSALVNGKKRLSYSLMGSIYSHEANIFEQTPVK